MPIWAAEIKELAKLYELIKGQFSELEKELAQLVKFDDPNVILLYSRRCLEVIITDLCESELKRERGSEPLKGIIDKLNKEKKIPSYIDVSMHSLNDLATFGTHPKEFDLEQVKPALGNLNIIIKWYLKFKTEKGLPGKKEIVSEHKNEMRAPVMDQTIAKKSGGRFLFIISGFLIIVIICYFIFVPFNIFRRDKLKDVRDQKGKVSIAVMPFRNMTEDTTKNNWQDWIQDILIGSLTNSAELEVRQSETINTYFQSNELTNYASITPGITCSISQKLDASIGIYGSIMKEGAKIRINATLIDAKTEGIFKSFQINGTNENVMPLIDTLSIMIKDFLEIHKLKKSLTRDIQSFASTNSPEAFRFFIMGENSRRKRDNASAIKWYSQAIDIDSNFFFAYNMISFSYVNISNLTEKGRDWCLMAHSKRDQMPPKQKIYADRAYAIYFGTPEEQINCLRQLLEFDDQMPILYYNLGWTYLDQMDQPEKAIPEYEKSLEIYKKWGVKPYWDENYIGLGRAYHRTGLFDKEKELYEKAKQDFPDNVSLIRWHAIILLTEGDTAEANRYIEKYIAIQKANSIPGFNPMTIMGNIYFAAGIPDKAEEYYRQAISLQPFNDQQNTKNILAYFLIDNDRDINKGMEIIDEALKTRPDDFNFLHTKGWGLYKQRKYQDALETLQKSWDLRIKSSFYNRTAFLHLEAAKKAAASQKRTDR